jgi:hypothetical protein
MAAQQLRHLPQSLANLIPVTTTSLGRLWPICLYAIVLMPWLTGFSWITGGSGENTLYSGWNRSTRALESIKVVDAANPKRLFNESVRVRPGGPDRFPIAPGGAQYPADTGLRVPEKVVVSWRELPPPGAEPYTGELQGPYIVEVRSRIPADVLRMASRDGYVLNLIFAFGESPVLFNWRLSRLAAGKGYENVACGGDAPDRYCVER